MTRLGNETWIETPDSTVSRETAQRLGAYIFPAGSIIFPKVGGALLTNKRRLLRMPSCIDNNVMGCVVRGADLDYAFTLLQQLDLGRLAKPGPVPAIGEGDVREIKVALPPSDEQRLIVSAVRSGTASLVSAISSAQGEIDLLREYRTRLIADVVTGKLDVREAAARLPDEPDEPEPLDEIEAEDETDEAGADNTDEVPEEAEA
jgi:type I restriction enzyme S subunit